VPKDALLQRMPGHVLGAAATAYEPRTRAASAPAGSRRYGGGAEEPVPAGAGRGHRPPNPAAQGPSWTPRTTPSPIQLLTGPRGRTLANIAASGPDQAPLIAQLVQRKAYVTCTGGEASARKQAQTQESPLHGEAKSTSASSAAERALICSQYYVTSHPCFAGVCHRRRKVQNSPPAQRFC
jgi:hypothetical protein